MPRERFAAWRKACASAQVPAAGSACGGLRELTQRRATLQRRCNHSIPQDRKTPVRSGTPG